MHTGGRRHQVRQVDLETRGDWFLNPDDNQLKSAGNYPRVRECLSTIRDNSHLGHLHSGGRCCMWGELEQVWYLKAISTGVMNMLMDLARQREGGACRCNSHRGHCK